jgi:hypothetical protein
VSRTRSSGHDRPCRIRGCVGEGTNEIQRNVIASQLAKRGGLK